ncbi:haloacid dehalogenase-like hydrolase [Clostridium estertheticum]|uniref:haloacid dehalogenase-like hydrolase n=1 Tax=Clostridium estertheticum TaxID=238834 RepID=UPI001CCBE57B|nr:haloacid dehalogenase-like hydrolase [Clostridium estertheticum]MBZ9607249.1 haloacid dehalogenase-like hydrolase [Clostridium estertheticum]
MMNKQKVLTIATLVCLTIGTFAGCGAEVPKGTNVSTLQQGSIKQLQKNNWSENNYNKINKLIVENGINSPGYNKDKRPYLVSDWDNTTAFNDAEETLLMYQLRNLEFKMTPEKFAQVIRTNIPKDNFAKECNNKDGKPVNIDLIAQDINSDYEYLYKNYKGLAGEKSLDEIKVTPEYQNFVAKTRYLYEAIGESFSSDISYPWVTYLFTGMNEKEARILARKSLDFNLADTVSKETIQSLSSAPGKAGVVSVTVTHGLRSFQEQQDLYKTLMSNGIDVYICSASFVDLVKEFASNPNYGYNIPEQNVLAMELERDDNGIIKNEFRKGYDQTQSVGKTKTIEKFLVSKYGYEPIMVSGDSDGDVYMLKDFKTTKLGLVLNRVKGGKTGEISKIASETIGKDNEKYLLQGIDENLGQFRPSEKSVLFNQHEEKLIK